MAGLVQQANNSATGSVTSMTVTLPSNPHDGSCLICLVAERVSGVAPSVVTGGGVTWIRAIFSNTNNLAEIWYGLSASSGGSIITITPNAAVSDCAAVVAEFSGVLSSNANDGAGANAFGIASPADTGNFTTLNPNDLLLAMACDRGSAVVGNSNIVGWTDFAIPAGTGNLTMTGSYQIVQAVSTYHDTWPVTNVFNWEAVLYALKVTPPTSPSLIGSATPPLVWATRIRP